MTRQVALILCVLAGAAGQERSNWWSLKPLARPPVPAVAGRLSRTPIDAFLQQQHAARGLKPAGTADRRTLIRRLSYDLHGLPPEPAEIERFVADPAPDAWERLVDRLLASPRYGERWARHWLDVAHYGESHGYDKDKPRRAAWPYRDYVIRSLNQDTPYTRFVQEQIAGDVMFPDDPQGVVATGFLAAGPWDFVGHVELREGTLDKNITRLLDRDDMLATTMSTFTSMTVHCARCHDHKFDPITQEDYYSLQAVFAGVDRAERPYDASAEVYRERRPLLEQRRALLGSLEPLRAIAAGVAGPQIQQLDARIRELRRNKAPREEMEAAAAERRRMVHERLEPRTRVKLESLESELAWVEGLLGGLPRPAMVYGAANVFETQGSFAPAWSPRPVFLLHRGSVESPGKAVGAGALAAVAGIEARFRLPEGHPEGARRAALAAWITDPRNPLPWRSIVNRVWHYHFGAGLVDTPNDFGRMGSPPTHPELLDWLAVEFREGLGGSLKKLHRLILTTDAWHRASPDHAANRVVDADNRYLWRMNRTRLDAESLRDAVLAASGNLDLTMGGPSVEQFDFKDDHSPHYDYARFDVTSPAARRRSIYRFLVRSVPDPFMESLDCPDASLAAPRRTTTLTALQALALLNDPFMVSQAEVFARRLESMTPARAGRVRHAYLLALGRAPRSGESAAMVEYARRHGLANACRLLFNSNEFFFVD